MYLEYKKHETLDSFLTVILFICMVTESFSRPSDTYSITFNLMPRSISFSTPIQWMMMNQKEKNSQFEMATSIMDRQSNLCVRLLAWRSRDWYGSPLPFCFNDSVVNVKTEKPPHSNVKLHLNFMLFNVKR